MTSTAAQKPAKPGKMACQPKLTTKSGMPRGTTTSTAHMRRPGSVVRSTNHASSGAQRRAEHGHHHGEADGVPAATRPSGCGTAGAAASTSPSGRPRRPGRPAASPPPARRHRRARRERRTGAMVPGQVVVMQVVAQPVAPVVPVTVAVLLAVAAGRCPWPGRGRATPLPVARPSPGRPWSADRRLTSPPPGAHKQLRLLQQLDRLRTGAQLRDGDRVRAGAGRTASRAAPWSPPTRWGTRSCRCGR